MRMKVMSRDSWMESYRGGRTATYTRYAPYDKIVLGGVVVVLDPDPFFRGGGGSARNLGFGRHDHVGQSSLS